MKPGVLLLLCVLGLNAYALLLIYMRSRIYRVPVYRPMAWNFLLSALPLGILLSVAVATGLVDIATTRGAAIVVGAAGLLIWLLLLPNSTYLITELNLAHRRRDDPVPLWYDIVAVLSFIMSGVANLVLGILIVQMGFVIVFFGDADNTAMHSTLARVLVVLIILTASIGIYLGRYLRLDSWDVRSLAQLRAKLREHFDSNAARGRFAFFCVTHTIFLGLMYGLIVSPLVDSMAHG
ncbi:DUF1361 domain-containing protein [Nocardia tengchongensis]|uniref:DUF1361 domain-containing protein n=2 Tax=Nocardia tengchongensis TaxID=2055889 RepID=UPI0036C88740